MTREWSVPCVYCGNKTWTINAVCRRRRCQAAEARYKDRKVAESHSAYGDSKRARVPVAHTQSHGKTGTRSFSGPVEPPLEALPVDALRGAAGPGF